MSNQMIHSDKPISSDFQLRVFTLHHCVYAWCLLS